MSGIVATSLSCYALWDLRLTGRGFDSSPKPHKIEGVLAPEFYGRTPENNGILGSPGRA